MDPLSDVLATLTLSSTLSSRFEGRGDWALRFPAYRHMKFGGVLAGGFQLWVDGEPQPVRLKVGDFYLLTNGMPFVSASSRSADPRRRAEDGPQAYRRHRDGHGIVRLDGRGAGVDAAVSGVSLAKGGLATLVLVHALRAYLGASQPPEGWLGAIADPRVGAALAALHEDPAQRWTVERLARTAGMSRTAFALRFKQLAGATPLDYLARWRMTLARRALRHSDEAIAGIAERVGYLSDTAFSSAFKRATGQSPARFRAESRTGADSGLLLQ
jgi:AraC-like DNA-binding protein